MGIENHLGEEPAKEGNDDEQQYKVNDKRKNLVNYIKGCFDSKNARLYGTFQERAALNITNFPKIQGSLLIRMGLVYPIVSALVEQMGVPKDAQTHVLGLAVNYHTWVAGYLSYVVEIQAGLSKYPIEAIGYLARKAKKMMYSSNDKTSA
jgi:hypothetical protein